MKMRTLSWAASADIFEVRFVLSGVHMYLRGIVALLATFTGMCMLYMRRLHTLRMCCKPFRNVCFRVLRLRLQYHVFVHITSVLADGRHIDVTLGETLYKAAQSFHGTPEYGMVFPAGSACRLFPPQVRLERAECHATRFPWSPIILSCSLAPPPHHPSL